MNKDAILSWFTGKGREKAAAALEMLAASEAQGYWVPGASRKVKAALNKANVAAKLGRRLREIVRAVEAADYARRLNADENTVHPARVDAHSLDMALTYGTPYTARVDWAKVEAGLIRVMDDEVRGIIAKGKAYCADLAAVDALIVKLDATRPVPTFTNLGVSKTIHATLKNIGVEGTVSTVRPCPVKWVQETRVTEDGKTYYVWVGELQWPEGTVHGRSRYNWTDHNRQCQACGHAIRNSYNWAALLIDDEKGTPLSLWVGKDCARTIFGIEVKGEVELKEGPGAK